METRALQTPMGQLTVKREIIEIIAEIANFDFVLGFLVFNRNRHKSNVFDFIDFFKIDRFHRFFSLGSECCTSTGA